MIKRFNFWNLQRFDEPAPSVTTTTETPGPNGEAGKPEEGEKPKEVEMVDITNPKTNKIVKLPKEFHGLITDVIEVSKSVAKQNTNRKVKEVQGRLDDLTKKLGGGGDAPSYEEMKQMLTDLQEKDLPEAERGKNELARKLSGMDKTIQYQTKRAETFRSKYEINEVEQAITKALDGHNIFNHGKTVRNIIADSNIRIEWEADSQGIETGNHKMIVEMMLPDESGELTMQEVSLKDGTSKWLALSQNANELKSNLSSGAGTSTTSGSRKDSTGQLIFKRSEIGGIKPPRRAEYLETVVKKLPHKIIDG